MSFAAVELQALKATVKGIKREGGYSLDLTTHPVIQQAIRRARLFGATEVEIKAAIALALGGDNETHRRD